MLIGNQPVRLQLVSLWLARLRKCFPVLCVKYIRWLENGLWTVHVKAESETHTHTHYHISLQFYDLPAGASVGLNRLCNLHFFKCVYKCKCIDIGGMHPCEREGLSSQPQKRKMKSGFASAFGYWSGLAGTGVS